MNPLILTTKEHKACHERWIRFKRDFSDRAYLIKRLFDLAEASVRAFGPHLNDVAWLDSGRLYDAVYGSCDPVDLLLDAMHFPRHSEVVDRPRTIQDVTALIMEHEQHGSDGLYMPRSVILGWIARRHDHILGDIGEAA
ncbi:hypothetical protein N9878_02205 [bacterium]|nr:hypothetical protein [bacterium]